MMQTFGVFVGNHIRDHDGSGGVSPLIFIAGLVAFLVIAYIAYRWLSGGAGSAKSPRSRSSKRTRHAPARRRS